jgi:hypothetical protein
MPYVYTCLVCGREFGDSALLVAHFEVEHADLDVVRNWRVFTLEGRWYPRSKVRDLLEAGLARRRLVRAAGGAGR